MFPNFPSHHEADSPQKLKLRSPDAADTEEPVEVVHCEAEHFRIAASILTDLQHPVRNLFPHVMLDLRLNRQEVVSRGRKIFGLFSQKSFEDSVISKDDWVVVRTSCERCHRRHQNRHCRFQEYGSSQKSNFPLLRFC